jgi:glycosyltransferase involved in cell wall biosynthesis
MRVIVVHNRYSSRVPSGENLSVDDDVRWLRDAGVDVVRHEVHNDDIVAPGRLARVREGVEAVWSPTARRSFAAALDAHRPDLVHVHNLFPLLTGSVPALAQRRGIPVVWTVHNRRVRCVAGGNFRAGAPCHECRAGWRVPGVVHRCYAASASASALVTVASGLFRSTARRDGVTAIGISDAMGRWLTTTGGFPAERVRVRHNGVAGPSAPVPPAAEQRTFLFLGRLSAYKGIELLLDAWRRADVDAELRIVGDGDMADDVAAAAAADPRITWLGQVAPDRIGEQIATARVVVVPSVLDEAFGRTAAEALAHGRPVITTGAGGLAEIVDDASGWVTGTDAERVARALTDAATDDRAVADRADAARDRWSTRFSPEATTAALLEVYDDARQSRPGAHGLSR